MRTNAVRVLIACFFLPACAADARVSQDNDSSTLGLGVSVEVTNGLGQKPVMGWSSWSVESSTRSGYGMSWLTEAHIKNASDALSKIQSAGYAYINIDSGWSSGHDENGIPVPNAKTFPDGIPGIASFVHAKGQKLGLYTIVGLPKDVYNANNPIRGTSCRTRDIARAPLTEVPNTWHNAYQIDWSNSCAQTYYDSIAARFASWGIDLLKVDGALDASSAPDIAAWGKALMKTGRPIWFTVSAWPVPLSIADQVNKWGNGIRIDTDVECYCSTVSSWAHSVSIRWNELPKWLPFVGSGSWADLDSMPIVNNRGNGIQDGINDTERQSVMTFWSMASAPLWIGGDIFFLDSAAQAILTNPEVIAIDQAARTPTQIAAGNQQKWKKTMPDGSLAVAVYNLGSSAADIAVSWNDLGLSGNARVRDLVARTDLGTFQGSWTAQAVPSHGSRLIGVTSSQGSSQLQLHLSF